MMRQLKEWINALKAFKIPFKSFCTFCSETVASPTFKHILSRLFKLGSNVVNQRSYELILHIKETPLREREREKEAKRGEKSHQPTGFKPTFSDWQAVALIAAYT